jgi:hypothetical protein
MRRACGRPNLVKCEQITIDIGDQCSCVTERRDAADRKTCDCLQIVCVGTRQSLTGDYGNGLFIVPVRPRNKVEVWFLRFNSAKHERLSVAFEDVRFL